MKDQKRPVDPRQGERPELERKLPYTPPLLQEYGRLSDLVQTAANTTDTEFAGGSNKRATM